MIILFIVTMSTTSGANSILKLHDQIPVQRHVWWLYTEDDYKWFKQLDKNGNNNCANMYARRLHFVWTLT